MHFGAVLNHLLGLHMHKIAGGPPAHEYGSEVHPHMIVYSPVVRACIGTEGAVGVIGPDRGGNSIHDVGFSGGNPSHGRRAYYIVQLNVLLLPVLRMVTGYDIALTVHKHMYDQCRGAFVATGHALYHREGGLRHLMGFLYSLLQLIGIFSNPGKEALDRHEVPLLAGLFAHVVALFLEPSQQETAVISPIDSVEEFSRDSLLVVPEGLEILVTLELSVFGPGHFLCLSFSLL